jgi:hypothetical protein
VHRAQATEWLALDDGDTTWLFDVEFLVSNYQCIYGRGCRSIDVEPDPTDSLGCCLHGAHFVDREDRKRVEAKAALLADDEWQHRSRAADRGPMKKKAGEWMTRRAKGACIFLNGADFAGGQGCALHVGALRRGQRPVDWKPAVCWQLPIRLDIHTDDYGHETVLVRAWQRRDWGPGGDDFNWWCTEADEAYSGTEPVYLSASTELVELVGQDLYERLVDELERLSATPVFLSSRGG